MIHTGDCLEVMAGMPADSVDAVVTDPPYNLEFMGKSWDKFGAVVEHPDDGEGPWGRTARVRYGKGAATFQAWCEAWGREALRVTKPGGYLLAFGGTRTHHRLVCGLEDAGWIIRDELTWVYASGFPKGRANLKPAHEPIVLARKPGPLRALNIDLCRIPGQPHAGGEHAVTIYGSDGNYEPGPNVEGNVAGRWPSNLLLETPELFDVANPGVVGSGAVSGGGEFVGPTERDRNLWGPLGNGSSNAPDNYGDSGGYSRFYLIPKSSRSDREPVLRGQLGENKRAILGQGIGGADNLGVMRENGHPTVKPTDLMRHLVRLVTPSGGTVLDCFLGSGSTAIACELEGFPWLGIEQDPGYVAIAEARLNGVQRGLGLDVPAPTRRQSNGPFKEEIAARGYNHVVNDRHRDAPWFKSELWDSDVEEPA